MLQGEARVKPDHYLIDEGRFSTGRPRNTWLLYAPKSNLLVRLNAAAALEWAAALEVRRAPQDPSLGQLWEELGQGAPAPESHCGRGATEPRELEPFRPCLVTLFLTNRCQLRCLYCYASAGQVPSRSMPFEVARAAVDVVVKNCLELGRKHFAVAFHGGGEASLEWKLLQRVSAHARERAAAAGLEVTFSLGTNGILSRAQCEWLAANLASATLSLDGPPDLQDRQRPTATGHASSPIVEASLASFHELGLRVSIRATITKASAHRQEEFVGYLASLPGVKQAQFQAMWPRGKGKQASDLAPDPEVFTRHFIAAKTLATRLGMRLTMSGIGDAGLLWDRGYCGAVGRNFSVTPAGEVSACYEVVDHDCDGAETFIFGGYDPTTGTFVIDEGKRARLAGLRGGDRSACQDCFCLPTCAGGCPVKVAQSGDYAQAPASPECGVIRTLSLHHFQLSLEERAPSQLGGKHDAQRPTPLQ